MDRREALKGMASTVAAPLVAGGPQQVSSIGDGEPLCPERFRFIDELLRWGDKTGLGHKLMSISIVETDVRPDDGLGWMVKAVASIPGQPSASVFAVQETGLPGLFAVRLSSSTTVWNFVKDRPFWAVRHHDGITLYRTDENGAYWTFDEAGEYVPHKGAPAYPDMM